MDCKSFLDLFSGEETTEKRMEEGATDRMILPLCNPQIGGKRNGFAELCFLL